MIARFLFTAAHALFWAATDARDIRNGKNINHPVRWALRAAIEVGASMVFAFIREYPIGIRLVLVAIAAAFLFSALFRFLLNTMRGRHWAYISPSSWYDSSLILFSILVGQLDIPRRDRFTIKEARLIMKDHNTLMKAADLHWITVLDGPDLNLLPTWYRKQVNRAGTLAYIFEAVVFAIITYLSAVL